MHHTNDITLAICAYNCEKYIEETLGCIADQTLQDFDLLIVNDCSTDNTRSLILEFFEARPRQFRLVDFEENRGLAAGRHYVENLVASKYILFVDADDCPYPTLVEKLHLTISSDDDLMAVGCYHEFINSEGRKIGGGIFMGETTKEGFYAKAANRKLIFMQPTAIVNREILLSVGGRNIIGFPEGKPRYQDLCEDLDLWTRMSDLYNTGKAIVVVSEVLCRYRKHEHGLSANSLGMILRMKHIKNNLLRRRSGENEQTFIDFYSSLSLEKLKSFEQDAEVAVKLRQGVFALKKGNFLMGVNNIIQSIWINPKYFWQKIKSNSGIFR